MKKLPLHAYVFLTGAAVLALELSASRLLAPSFGTSLAVWGNILGIVLGALAAGYYFGGRLADRSPDAFTLGCLTWIAGLATCLIPLMSSSVLRGVSDALEGAPIFFIIASFFGMLLLFALPLFLLGALSPLALRLGARDLKETGSVSGSLSAASTAGSLFGAFLPAFVTIPFLGTRATILGAGVLLIALGAAAMRKRRALGALALPLALVLMPVVSAVAIDGTVFERESPYQYVRVFERGGQKHLITDAAGGIQSSSLKLDGTSLAYADAAAALPALLPERPLRVLLIGLAGGSIARELRGFFPPERLASVTVAEIDPVMLEAARAHFGLRDEEAEVVIKDGRRFLAEDDGTYDLIMSDAYSSMYVPFHLTTREFVRLAKSRLAEDGLLAFNVIGSGHDDALVSAVAATAHAEFASVETARVDPEVFNFLVLASAAPLPWPRLETVPEPLRPAAESMLADHRDLAPGGRILTDDKAPVEWLTDRFIWRMATEYVAD